MLRSYVNFGEHSVYNKKLSGIPDVKRILFLINGNPSFHGKLILIDTRLHSDFKIFIKYLKSQLSQFILKGQNIKRIFTPRGQNSVCSTSQLVNGGLYICAGNEPFQKMNDPDFRRLQVNFKEAQMNDLSKLDQLLKRPKVKEFNKSNHSSKLVLPGINHPNSVDTNLTVVSSVKHNFNVKDFSSITNKIDANNISHTSQLINNDYKSNNKVLSNETTTRITKILRLLPTDNQKYPGRKITVVRCNPDGKGRTSLSVIMARRAVHTLGQVMCELTEAFSSRWHNDPVRHLYSLTGREIRSVNELFRKDKVFIAAGFHKIFGNIHIELNKSNIVHNTTNATVNNNINCIRQSVNHSHYQQLHHYRLHPNQAKGSFTTNNAMELKPEDIKTILSEFWPDHPDPSSVVYQWERRLKSRGIVTSNEQSNTNKHILFDVSKSKQKLSLKGSNNIIPNAKHSLNDSFIENEKKDSGFDEMTNNNILPKIDEEHSHDEQPISLTRNSITAVKDKSCKSFTESHTKQPKYTNNPQQPGSVKTNYNYSNLKLDDSAATVEENNFYPSEKFNEQLSIHNRPDIKLHEKSNLAGLVKPKLLQQANANDDINTQLHVNSVAPLSSFYYSTYQQNLSKHRQKLHQPPIYLHHPPFLLPSSLFKQQQQQQHKNQQPEKSDSLSKILSRYHNCLQIGQKVLRQTEERRHELAMKENQLPENYYVAKVYNITSSEIKTSEENILKSFNCQRDGLNNLINTSKKLTSNTSNIINEASEAQINKIDLDTEVSPHHPSKFTNQSVTTQKCKITQQIKANTPTTNTNIVNTTSTNFTKNKSGNTGIVFNKIQGNISSIVLDKQPQELLKSTLCLKTNVGISHNNNEVLTEEEHPKIGVSPPIITNSQCKNHESHISSNVDNHIKMMNAIPDSVTTNDHSSGFHKEASAGKKSLSIECIHLNRQQKSPKLSVNKTFDKNAKQIPTCKNVDLFECNANADVDVTQQKHNMNMPDGVTNGVPNATSVNIASPVKPINISDGAHKKLIANCFTVNGIRKPTIDKPKSIYAAVGVTYVSDPEYLSKRYQVGRKLGDGNFAIVKLGKRRDSNDQYALKIIEKSKITGKEAMLLNEIHILHHCRHPNIIRLYEEFETSNEIWLVMEFIKDGDLFDGITKATKFTEPIAAGIVSDLASALFYLHCRSIVHRDLKPENILLLRQKNGQIRVKLADFGLALVVTRNMYTVCGTPTYIAPEILEESGYGLEVDMWALGIITYIMLCGFAPFRSNDRRQSKLFESIKRGHFVFLSPYWDNISSRKLHLFCCIICYCLTD
ncbi:Serine/threonine-protein kinase DCLK3 [Schistosoma japonicum]|nr:Serine/threonine-protein kinase DCLK3 [Schistosoma japonicum]